MTTKTLIITPQGTAKEINPLGENPRKFEWIVEIGRRGQIKVPTKKQFKWQTIEDSLKEYKIVNGVFYNGYILYGKIEGVRIGETCNCEVNEEDKTAIIK